MSINFSTLKGLAIPEGNVTQIADASGRVLWSAVKKAVITIEGSGGDYAYVVIDGVTYNTAGVVEVPVGTVVKCVTSNNYAGMQGVIRSNYQTVVKAENATYDYTVAGDATITLSQFRTSIMVPYWTGLVEIVDENAPSGARVNVTVSGVTTALGTGRVTVNGDTYSAPVSVGVALGDVVTCSCGWASHAQYGNYGGQIKLNGTMVADRVTGVNPTVYELTVSKDVTIDFAQTGSPTGVVTNINITEL